MKNQIKLPAWLKLGDLKKIFNTLSVQGESRLVGGCVRDILSGNVGYDIDIATQVTPDNVMGLFTRNAIKYIPTGLKHGTVTAILNGVNYEVTTLRQDKSCNGRHATVSYTLDWEADAARRDFTVNAMYLDLEGRIYDYFNGRSDLAKKIIKFVGNPEQRIVEDYLRILRYFRFYGYFGGDNLDVSSFNACCLLADNISKLSGERIKSELLKILGASHAKEAVKMIFENDILSALSFKPKFEDYKCYNFGSDPYLNFASLILSCEFDKIELKNMVRRLKFSNKERTLITTLCYEMADVINNLLKNLYYFGPELTYKQLVLYNIMQPGLDLEKEHEVVANYKHKKLPVDGNDIMKLGCSGKLIAKMIKHAEEKWILSNFTLRKEQLLHELEEYKSKNP